MRNNKFFKNCIFFNELHTESIQKCDKNQVTIYVYLCKVKRKQQRLICNSRFVENK